MSAYSDHKYGLITDAEYNSICKEEEFWDKYYDAHPEELNDEEEEVFEEDEIDEF